MAIDRNKVVKALGYTAVAATLAGVLVIGSQVAASAEQQTATLDLRNGVLLVDAVAPADGTFSVIDQRAKPGTSPVSSGWRAAGGYWHTAIDIPDADGPEFILKFEPDHHDPAVQGAVILATWPKR